MFETNYSVLHNYYELPAAIAMSSSRGYRTYQISEAVVNTPNRMLSGAIHRTGSTAAPPTL